MKLLIIALLAAPALASSAFAAEPAPGQEGAGSQKLVVPAIGYARANWQPDACLAGVEYVAYRSRLGDRWTFKFYSPSDPLSPKCVAFGKNGLPEFDFACQGVAEHCITEMSVDSGRAVAIAYANGLIHGQGTGFRIELHKLESTVAGRGAMLYRQFAQHRGRTVWFVESIGRTSEVVVDARTGRVLRSDANR